MCIAIFKPEGVILPESALRNSFRNNPDGAGFMYVKNRELIIEKGLMRYSDFRKAYKPHENKRVVLHFRATSHGATNEENTHPHSVTDKIAFVHNGIIRKVEHKAGTQDSDTVIFNEQMLKKLPEKFLKSAGLRKLIEDYIGFSKLVFMTNTGTVYIFNAQQGEADEHGVWYSNDSYKDSVTKERRGQILVYDEEKGDFVPKAKPAPVNTTKALPPSTNSQYRETLSWKDTETPTKQEPLAFNSETNEWYLSQYQATETTRIEHCSKCGAPMFKDTEQELGCCSVCLSSAKCPKCKCEISIEEIAYGYCSTCKHSLTPEEQLSLVQGSKKIEPEKSVSGSEDTPLDTNPYITGLVRTYQLETVSSEELIKRAEQMQKILVDKFEGR